jgi:hypothetical protein
MQIEALSDRKSVIGCGSGKMSTGFYILLTVHLEEIVDFNQLDALCSLFFNVFILSPLHVSSDKRPSSGGNKLY